mmetsp:Transcript_83334/g.97410  ORF Transcript_83334/g.97410 Transcript_83334/m.97410 type:complete len:330 (-) Transcript_83334:313-1302(-)
MECIVEPVVFAGILDHFTKKSRVDPVDLSGERKLINRCRGFLLGSVTATTVTINNFLPDTYNLPDRPRSEKEVNEYKKAMSKYTEQLKAGIKAVGHHFGKSSILGFYSVTDGQNFIRERLVANLEERTCYDISEFTEAFKYIPIFSSMGRAFHLDIRVPTVEQPSVDMSCRELKFAPGQGKLATVATSVPVRVYTSSSSVNAVMEHVITETFGASSETALPPAVDIDHALASLQGDAKAFVMEVAEKLQKAAQSAPATSELAKAVAELREVRSTPACSAVAESRKTNALLLKYVVGLIQEQVASIDYAVKHNVESTANVTQRFTRRRPY